MLLTTKAMPRFACSLAIFALALCGAAPATFAQSSADLLKSGFETPPESAKPRVWWHWMNGNITKEGIHLDLEWMHRAGVGGFQTFDAALFTPQVVKKRLAYMTPDWQDAFKYATTEADRLGLEEAIAGSPGWSETGGPWVPANEAMKKYVWSEMRVEGGKPFTGTLPHPPSNTGAFQNLGVEDVGDFLGGSFKGPQYYADSVVVAYKVADTDVPLASLHPTITTSSGTIDPALLSDGDLVKTVSLPMPSEVGQKAWILYEFPQPETIRAITIVSGQKSSADAFTPPGGDSGKELEASDDGENFHLVIKIPKGGTTEQTLAFAPVTAKYFRVTFRKLPDAPNPMEAAGFPSAPPRKDMPIAELVLHPGARVNLFEEKAAFKQVPDLYQDATVAYSPADAIKKDDVIDLTGKMRPDGSLDWTPPAGTWEIVRFGYSLLGITNHPATKEATGLEVDKLNAGYVKHYMDNYLDSYKKTVGADEMGKRGIRYVITDSWEAGAQNWTDNMIQEFTKRRGYSPIPWMPVLTGRIEESSRASDQFLWDLRKTIADLTADEHYGQVEASLKERGMGHYGESHEDNRAFIADGMEVKKLDDIPMSAMWVQKPGVFKPTYNYNADDRESASVAHIYGQNLAAAESMTSCDALTAWAWSPETLKPTADQEFLNGINRFVIHESAHQALTDKVPGITLGPCGQWFNRNDTWAEQARVWTRYLARNSYLLQQGKFAADVVYFYGEDSNVTAIFHDSSPDVPAGYNFDYINADGLIHELNVSDGRITTKSGMSYRVLALDKYSRHMSLPVLKAIYNLVEQGAVVAGAKPVGTPSLADDQAEFSKLNNELFGSGNGVQSVGKGRVYAGQDADSALKALNVEPDFNYSNPGNGQKVEFVHRKLADGDLYFVDNRGDKNSSIDASFRVTGKVPELWYSETGKVVPVSYKIADGRTTVPLHFEPWGTVFVVFRKPAKKNELTLPAVTETQLATVEGPWTLAFQPDRGAPASITLDKLISWNDSADSSVKYFSGTGTYTKTINAEKSWFKKGTTLWLDLGDVKNIAIVTVNGKELGTVWHAPYLVDVSGALKPGSNAVTIKVINAWVNRIIGDQQPGVTTKYTFETWNAYKADSPLLPSGLIGPVAVIRQTGN
ncbi:MAG: glycoside hydrolase [Acidobacteriota bacterium]|nr:glycoside hydrolase [Acidobacteriota bacterium]